MSFIDLITLFVLIIVFPSVLGTFLNLLKEMFFELPLFLYELIEESFINYFSIPYFSIAL